MVCRFHPSMMIHPSIHPFPLLQGILHTTAQDIHTRGQDNVHHPKDVSLLFTGMAGHVSDLQSELLFDFLLEPLTKVLAGLEGQKGGRLGLLYKIRRGLGGGNGLSRLWLQSQGRKQAWPIVRLLLLSGLWLRRLLLLLLSGWLRVRRLLVIGIDHGPAPQHDIGRPNLVLELPQWMDLQKDAFQVL